MSLGHYSRRLFATAQNTVHHKILIVGAGSAGIPSAAQLRKSLKSGQHELKDGDVAIIDPSAEHHYQPGWTLVGGGVAPLDQYTRPTSSLLPKGVSWIQSAVASFSPEANLVHTADGQSISYDYLVVAPGIKLQLDAIKGLSEALQDSSSNVSSIYVPSYAPKLSSDVEALKGGKAIFTQPQGVIKCAGAPQKAMWQSLRRFREASKAVDVSFITGMPSMFAVPKYSKILNALREEKGVEGLFGHDLVEIDYKNRVAKFKHADGILERSYDLLHVTPKMGPHAFVKESALADQAGYVDVNSATLQHKKFPNVFAIGDASNLPTSKTIAAITGQVPVLANNLSKLISGGDLSAKYSGYTSCPLILEDKSVLLAEFKYALEVDETFSSIPGLDQSTPRKLFYQMKKELFPRMYFGPMMQGSWYGRTGLMPPRFN